MVVADHFDALDFDLFDRWLVRLRDVPLSIGWGAVALFIRHLPRDSETAREMEPVLEWSEEAHMLANLLDILGPLFVQDYARVPRPGLERHDRYEGAAEVSEDDFNAVLSIFDKGGANG